MRVRACWLLIAVLLGACLDTVVGAHHVQSHYGGHGSLRLPRRSQMSKRSAVSWLTNISSSISDWMFGSVKPPAKTDANRPKRFNGGPSVLDRMPYPYTTGMVPRNANDTLSGTGLPGSWMCMIMDVPASTTEVSPVHADQQSDAGSASDSSFKSPVSGSSEGSVPQGASISQGAIPDQGSIPGQSAGAGGSTGAGIPTNMSPVTYVNYNGQLIPYQQYLQILASQQAQSTPGNIVQQPAVASSGSTAGVPAGYINFGGQLITQQQYNQIVGQAQPANGLGTGATAHTSNPGTAFSGAVGGGSGSSTNGLGSTDGVGGLAGANAVQPAVGVAGGIQKREPHKSENEALHKRQAASNVGSESGDGTGAPSAQVMVCVNGDLDVSPIKFDTMTGVRIMDTAASTDGVIDVTNLPNYKTPWMPFLPTQSMWDEQQILMLAQEHQIQYSTDVGPPPSSS